MFCCQRTSGMTDLTLFPRPGLLPICQIRSPETLLTLSKWDLNSHLRARRSQAEGWGERGAGHTAGVWAKVREGLRRPLWFWEAVPTRSSHICRVTGGRAGGHFSQLMGHQHTFIRVSWGAQVPGSHPLQKFCKYKLETSGLAFPSLGFGQGYNQWSLLASFNDL